MNTRLTFKQQAFINEYLIDFNAAAAARRAGYKGDPVALANIGRQNLSKPRIRKVINERLDQWAMPTFEVFLRLSRLASASMADFISSDPTGDVRLDLKKAYQLGAMDNLKYLAIDQRFSPSGASRTSVRLSLHDSLAALSQLAKAHGLQKVDLAYLPSEELALANYKVINWYKVILPQVAGWLIQTYGDLETGIVTVCKKHFGEEMEIPREFILYVLNVFLNHHGKYRFYLNLEQLEAAKD